MGELLSRWSKDGCGLLMRVATDKGDNNGRTLVGKAKRMPWPLDRGTCLTQVSIAKGVH